MRIIIKLLSHSSDVPYMRDESYEHYYENKEHVPHFIFDDRSEKPLHETKEHMLKRLGGSNEPEHKINIKTRTTVRGNELSNSPEPNKEQPAPKSVEHYYNALGPQDFSGRITN